MMQLSALKQKTNALNVEIYTLYLSYRDQRVHWSARILLAFAIGYAISPIDFIPDMVAVFGFLDDVIVVALGFHFSYHLLSKTVVEQARLQAFDEFNGSSERAVNATRIVNYVWLLAFTFISLMCYKFLHTSVL
ncbi:YkvA family protein [Pontibacter sp. MBLB2868]|uniref:YkvA family protein n=1 Tax=Pontibacter sp. MBLB2868 TaxID=3451555 RepID=UPI003F75626A